MAGALQGGFSHLHSTLQNEHGVLNNNKSKKLLVFPIFVEKGAAVDDQPHVGDHGRSAHDAKKIRPHANVCSVLRLWPSVNGQFVCINVHLDDIHHKCDQRREWERSRKQHNITVQEHDLVIV